MTKIHLLLIGEEHPEKRGDYKRDTHITAIKEFKPTKVCLELPRTEKGEKLCEEIRKEEKEVLDWLSSWIIGYVDDFYTQAIEFYPNYKKVLGKIFSKNALEKAIPGNLESVKSMMKINIFGQMFQERKIEIRDFQRAIIKEAEVYDIEFIDTIDEKSHLLNVIKTFCRELKIHLKIEALSSKNGIDREDEMWKNIEKVLKKLKKEKGEQRVALVTGYLHAQYFFEKMKDDDEIEIDYRYIQKNGTERKINNSQKLRIVTRKREKDIAYIEERYKKEFGSE